MAVLAVPDDDLLKEMAGHVAGADTHNWAVDGRCIAAPTTFDDIKMWRWPAFTVPANTAPRDSVGAG